jgi:hypothetical protein
MPLDPALAATAANTPTVYDHWGTNAIVVLATIATVCVCVLLHYEALSLLSRRLALRRGPHRFRVVLAIFGLLGVHIAEIWIFGIACGLLLLSPLAGEAHGLEGGVLDFIYLSAMLFTTVGASDAFVTGPVRFLTGTEALTGLVLITWSASFTFIEMQRFWRDR